MNPEIQALQSKITDLENKLSRLLTDFEKHQHDGLDGTNILRKKIKLDVDQFIDIGLGGIGSLPLQNQGTATENVQLVMSVGKDDGRSGFVNKADIAEIVLFQQPRASDKFASLLGLSGMVVSPTSGTVSVTSGGNTITINGFNFTTDELAGSIINIYNSSGSYIETQTIASNTSTVITISGTWSATTSGGSFFIYNPLYLGKSDYSFERLYVMGLDSGGIRFGTGPTNTGSRQNGLLYMDATGDLYWRNKAGTSTKLN